MYAEIIGRYVEAYNRLDVDGMLRDADAAIVFENISNGEANMRTAGIEELRKQAEESKRYFAERRQVITGIRFAEEEVEAEIVFTGLLAADFPDGFKAGDKVWLRGKTIFRFKDDKLIGITDIS